MRGVLTSGKLQGAAVEGPGRELSVETSLGGVRRRGIGRVFSVSMRACSVLNEVKYSSLSMATPSQGFLEGF
jgi:hypothetical protein